MNAEKAAQDLLRAFAVVSAPGAKQWPGHSICGYSCGCRELPEGWPKRPPTHPRGEACHP